MSDNNMWIRAQKTFQHFGVDLIVLGEEKDGTGRRVVVDDIIYKTVNIGDAVQPKALPLSKEAATQLMDDMWLCGIRPSESINNVNDKTDIKAHLEDMRRIVFSGINIKLDTGEKKE